MNRQLTSFWIAIAAVVLVLSATGCGSDPEQSVLIAAAESELPRVDLSRKPVADSPDPSIGAGAASDHVDCDYGVSQGLGAIDFGPPQPSFDPDAALTLFITQGLFPLPRHGYMAVGQDEHRRLYTYSVDASSKVSIVVADSAEVELDAEGEGWTVEAFATCDPAEHDSSFDDQLPFEIWLDETGRRVPSSVVSSASGPEHCDLESATFLSIDNGRYVADPDGVLGDLGSTTPFDGDAELPTGAVDTGYRRDSRRLWLSQDRETAYVVDGDRIEAWPSLAEPYACA